MYVVGLEQDEEEQKNVEKDEWDVDGYPYGCEMVSWRHPMQNDHERSDECNLRRIAINMIASSSQ